MKKLFKRKEHETVKAVFSVTVDTNYEYRNRSFNNGDEEFHLQPGGRYFFSNRKKNSEESTSYENISDFVSGVLSFDLVDTCRQYLDFPISIVVTGRHDGSLVLVFAAIFDAVSFISGAKDVFDVAMLIRDIAKERVEKRLRQEYGDYFDIQVQQRLPRESSREYAFDIEHKLRKGRIPFAFLPSREPSQLRDAFFWYLLVANILLVGMIVLLVIKAVLKVYW